MGNEREAFYQKEGPIESSGQTIGKREKKKSLSAGIRFKSNMSWEKKRKKGGVDHTNARREGLHDSLP